MVPKCKQHQWFNIENLKNSTIHVLVTIVIYRNVTSLNTCKQH